MAMERLVFLATDEPIDKNEKNKTTKHLTLSKAGRVLALCAADPSLILKHFILILLIVLAD